MKKAQLFRKEKGKVRCLACLHKCLISGGKTGICGVRKNVDGKLYLLVYGKVAAMNIDPIEKKPLYHFLSGSKAFSIGTVGCNFSCEWCQNFDISQVSKEGEKRIFGKEVKTREIVELALESGCKSIAYTYNEPAIFIEFVRDVARIAKKKGLKNILVTNGYFTEESFKYFNKEKLIDAVNIDLKSFSDKTYRKFCGAKLESVLENIKRFYDAGIHIEITTLVIPGLNDSSSELTKIAKFIATLDKNIPWHISRYFPRYKFAGKNRVTPIETLKLAEKIGKKYLNYVYLGNV